LRKLRATFTSYGCGLRPHYTEDFKKHSALPQGA
jgi:hypothetical protein